MVLHTIVSEYDIFAGTFPEAPTVCQALGGRYLEWEATAQGPRLRRIISTDPADYLRPYWQPGCRPRSGR